MENAKYQLLHFILVQHIFPIFIASEMIVLLSQQVEMPIAGHQQAVPPQHPALHRPAAGARRVQRGTPIAFHDLGVFL